MKKKFAVALLTIMLIFAVLWAATIIVGLMGCTGYMTVAQCFLAWITLTAGALIASILVGLNALTNEKAARANGRQAKKKKELTTNIIPPTKLHVKRG